MMTEDDSPRVFLANNDNNPEKRYLVGRDASIFKTVGVMIYCHFSVALLCLNVLFDLFFLGTPVYLLHKIKVLPMNLYLGITTAIINWTTPIVFFMPLVFSGSKVYCNDIALLEETKSKNSLLLSNHGSRIDWMIGMFVGFSRRLTTKTVERVRVGFVCEALIQFMPLIGWYRKLVCHDVFVWRSFLRDAPTINRNIEDFHSVDEKRMLFLSPEGRSAYPPCRQFVKNFFLTMVLGILVRCRCRLWSERHGICGSMPSILH